MDNHPIRTANHKSPQQLFTAGLLLLQHSCLETFDYLQDVDDAHGVDPDGPVGSEAEDHLQGVAVPESIILPKAI